MERAAQVATARSEQFVLHLSRPLQALHAGSIAAGCWTVNASRANSRTDSGQGRWGRPF